MCNIIITDTVISALLGRNVVDACDVALEASVETIERENAIIFDRFVDTTFETALVSGFSTA